MGSPPSVPKSPTPSPLLPLLLPTSPTGSPHPCAPTPRLHAPSPTFQGHAAGRRADDPGRGGLALVWHAHVHPLPARGRKGHGLQVLPSPLPRRPGLLANLPLLPLLSLLPPSHLPLPLSLTPPSPLSLTPPSSSLPHTSLSLSLTRILTQEVLASMALSRPKVQVVMLIGTLTAGAHSCSGPW